MYIIEVFSLLDFTINLIFYKCNSTYFNNIIHYMKCYSFVKYFIDSKIQ